MNNLATLVLAEDIFRRIFLLPIDKSLLASLSSLCAGLEGSSLDNMGQFFSQLSLSDERADEFRWEFNELFLFKPKAIPYESAYFGQGLFSQRCASVRQSYERAGIRRAGGEYADDYVGYELEFLHFLGLKALSCDKVALGARREFISQHCGLWFSQFALNIKAANPSPEWLEFAQLFATYSEILTAQGE
ncbi:molecular chaperone [Campylobacter sp. 19-13652]|uniref:TorD/DmsD family molecular chaperone n=1 Tax=Campylobacter sp. 19-13652 TaxID=2840180 RepID=UPI001C751DD7|nr:molecular chaperone TorD family protein [Campylobacter sp. 19-13652]BCX79933.1 hypothetical protein LBC_13950 [Campylobacter sp. 19-13652]